MNLPPELINYILSYMESPTNQIMKQFINQYPNIENYFFGYKNQMKRFYKFQLRIINNPRPIDNLYLIKDFKSFANKTTWYKTNVIKDFLRDQKQFEDLVRDEVYYN